MNQLPELSQEKMEDIRFKLINIEMEVKTFIKETHSLFNKLLAKDQPKLRHQLQLEHKCSSNVNQISNYLQEYDEQFNDLRNSLFTLQSRQESVQVDQDHIKKKEEFLMTFMRNTQQGLNHLHGTQAGTQGNNTNPLYLNLNKEYENQLDTIEKTHSQSQNSQKKSLQDFKINIMNNLDQIRDSRRSQLKNNNVNKSNFDQKVINQLKINGKKSNEQSPSSESIDQLNNTNPTNIYQQNSHSYDRDDHDKKLSLEDISLPSREKDKESDKKLIHSYNPDLSNQNLKLESQFKKNGNGALNKSEVFIPKNAEEQNDISNQNKLSDSWRAFPKNVDESKDEKDDNYLWLKMPEDLNQGAWDPQYDSQPSEDSEILKMNSMERCKVLNDRILQGAIKKCSEMLEKYQDEDQNDLNLHSYKDSKSRQGKENRQMTNRIFQHSQSLKKMTMSKRSFSEDAVQAIHQPNPDPYYSIRSTQGIKRSQSNLAFMEHKNNNDCEKLLTKTIVLDMVNDKNNSLAVQEREMLVQNQMMNLKANQKEIGVEELLQVKNSFLQLQGNSVNQSGIVQQSMELLKLNISGAAKLQSSAVQHLNGNKIPNKSIIVEVENSLKHVQLEDILQDDSFEHQHNESSDIIDLESVQPDDKESMESARSVDDPEEQVGIIKANTNNTDLETMSSISNNKRNLKFPVNANGSGKSKIPKQIKKSHNEQPNKNQINNQNRGL